MLDAQVCATGNGALIHYKGEQFEKSRYKAVAARARAWAAPRRAMGTLYGEHDT